MMSGERVVFVHPESHQKDDAEGRGGGEDCDGGSCDHLYPSNTLTGDQLCVCVCTEVTAQAPFKLESFCFCFRPLSIRLPLAFPKHAGSCSPTGIVMT